MRDNILVTSDVITRLADKGYTKKDSAEILNDVLDVIYEAIRAGEEVHLIGFGAFSVIEASARKIYNIHTGRADRVDAHKKIKFKPGTALCRAAEGLGA